MRAPRLVIDWPDGHQLAHDISHINLLPLTGGTFGYEFSEFAPKDEMVALTEMVDILAPHVPKDCTWSVMRR